MLLERQKYSKNLAAFIFKIRLSRISTTQPSFTDKIYPKEGGKLGLFPGLWITETAISGSHF